MVTRSKILLTMGSGMAVQYMLYQVCRTSKFHDLLVLPNFYQGGSGRSDANFKAWNILNSFEFLVYIHKGLLWRYTWEKSLLVLFLFQVSANSWLSERKRVTPGYMSSLPCECTTISVYLHCQVSVSVVYFTWHTSASWDWNVDMPTHCALFSETKCSKTLNLKAILVIQNAKPMLSKLFYSNICLF